MALIKCPECEGLISEKATFCIHCGYPIKTAQPGEITCPFCGERLPDDSSFCGFCGKNLNATASNELIERDKTLPNSAPTNIMDYSKPSVPVNYKGIIDYTGSSNVARCPRCGSTSISLEKQGFGYGKATLGALTVGPIGLLAGGINANKPMCICMKCGHKYILQE